MSDQSSDFLKWMPFVAAVAAWVAAIFAYLTARRSIRLLHLAEQQEERRRPVLILYLQGGRLRRVGEDLVYMFLLSVSNRSDSNNAIAQIDLRIEYRTAFNFLAAVDVPIVSQDDEMFGGDTRSRLEIPIRVDAHHTVAGWVFFRVKKALLEDCAVNTYVIVATDSHGGRSSIETALVQEIVHEAEIKTN
jgi:hypothetical protein